uniref:Si:ch211-267e7.3 n=1 Tax=Neogobius melanostomus TaxID=47308 RepID=A0A8C6ST36_9GOBI
MNNREKVNVGNRQDHIIYKNPAVPKTNWLLATACRSACPSPSVSFKQHQCSQFNSKAFGRRYYQWIPLYPADYISISNKPCDLQCTTISGERQLLVPAHDGTFCRDTKHHGVCIEGTCQPIGCDGELYSTKTVDRCGVCGGGGTSCQRVFGSYRKALTQLGYAFVTNIPHGATDIQIIERHKTENILALSDEAGHFFFNGNSLFDHPQNFRVAGTVFKYRRPSSVYADGLEYIIAQGPTLQGLNVMVTRLNFTFHSPNWAVKRSNGKKTQHCFVIVAFRLSLLYTCCSCDHSNDFDVGLDQDISSISDMYRWKVSAYAPCSSTCTTGISSSYALCVRYDGTEVDDTYCDSVTRPEPTHEFCTGKECPPRWETSGWSECSRTCGEGSQYRTVRCWKMLSPGLDSSVYDSLCLSHDLHKPANRKVCSGLSCGPQWEISEWSQCSARCGTQGERSREVRCSMEEKLCNKTSRPSDGQPCEGGPCDRRWTVSDWGPCSGACGEGRMVRAVMCRSPAGLPVAEEQCDPSIRPLAVHPCGDRDCAPHWVQQEWQQCNASCGRGVRLRQVVCAGLEGGLFKEWPNSSCEQEHRPEIISPCFQRPCSKWFTTAWSQCSKTCGSGVQVREVKCYQGDELPEARQSCELQSCPTPPPDVLCQDKPTANCALVLKVKLCSHWYYRKACCQSCRAPRP